MWNQKLCLGTSDQFGVQKEEQIVLMKKTGFDGFFCMYENGKYRGEEYLAAIWKKQSVNSRERKSANRLKGRFSYDFSWCFTTFKNFQKITEKLLTNHNETCIMLEVV